MTDYIASDGCTTQSWMGQKRPRLCNHGYAFEKVKAPPVSDVRLAPVPKEDDAPPSWLTKGFAIGVDIRTAEEALGELGSYSCWLAQFDPEERPCDPKLERFHFISRQRVAEGLDKALRGAEFVSFEGEAQYVDRAALIQLAEWDPRNGGIGCTGHHRRFDSHMTPRLVVPARVLPGHVRWFIADWGLELEAEAKFPGFGSEQAVAA